MAVVRLETGDHQPENGFVSSETTSTGLLSQVDGSVLPFLGGFGKYQKQLIVLTWIPALFIGFSQFSDYFLLAQPNNTCVHPTATAGNPTASSSSFFNGSNSAPYLYADGTHNDSRSTDCSCMEWNYELETGLVQNVVTKWNLVCDSAWKVHIAKFSLLVGSIFGYLVLGVLADWFGRRPVLITSVLFMMVFGLTVAFSINVPMFSTLRFFEGFCLAGISLSLYVLRIELCLPMWRFQVTMVTNFVVLAGQLLMPGLAALCRDWQVLQAVIICPLILMLSYIWIFPESLRWLLSTQQYWRAKHQMIRIARKNKVMETDEIFSEIQREMQKKPKKTCIVKMVGTRNLWKNIVVLCVNSLTGYGIHHCFARSMIDPEMGETSMFHNFYADYYTMAGIAVASCMALCPAVGFMGRRGGLLTFMIITALASLLQLGLLTLLGKYSVQLNIERSETLKKNFSIAFSIIGMFSSHAVSNLSIFFCAEITPTVIRGGGLGLVLASAGFGMLTAPIMELHNQKGYFLHHIIFACCTLICIICILLLPETRYQPLPETIGDGENYTRQPLLPPKKLGEQDPLLKGLQRTGRPQGQETPLQGSDDPDCAIDTAAPPCDVEDVAPCIIDTTLPDATESPPPYSKKATPSVPTCVIEVMPLCSTGALPPCTTGATDSVCPSVTDTAPPTATDIKPPCSIHTASPTATDTKPLCSTDTAPSSVTDITPPRITDTAHPSATDTKPLSSTDTEPFTAKDTKPPCSTDTAPPTVTDITPSRITGTAHPSATDTTPSCTTDTASPTATDTKPSCSTDTASPTATDTKPSCSTDTAPPTATDIKPPCSTDTAPPTSTDTKSPRITDTAHPSATDTTPSCSTDTAPPTATDIKPPCSTDTAPPTSTDIKPPRITDTAHPSATDTTPFCSTDKAPSTATDTKPLCSTDTTLPTAMDTPPCARDTISPSNVDATPLCTPDTIPTCATDPVSPSTMDATPSYALDVTPLCTVDSPPSGAIDSPDVIDTIFPSPTNALTPCAMNVLADTPTDPPITAPATDTATDTAPTNAGPLTPDSAPPNTTTDATIPMNGTANGVRSS